MILLINMKTIFEHIRNNLHERLNIQETSKYVSIDELRGTEWSQEFERLQRNRMLMGSLRYGRLGKEGKPQYNRTEDFKRLITRH